MDWKEQKVVIIGAARQGTALAKYLVEKGAKVTLTDNRNASELDSTRQALENYTIHWVLGEHPLELLEGADWLSPSGGVPLTIPLVVEAQRYAIPLTNDSQVFLEEVPCRVVGITGSAGKTTTVTLVGRIAEASLAAGEGPYSQVFVGGNIGNPLLASIEEIQADDLVVMELSSFQLEIMTRSPQVAVLLNLTPNHLDRHVTMQAYTDAKMKIFEHQTPQDIAVLNRDDPGSWQARKSVKGQVLSFGIDALGDGQSGAFIQNDAVWLRTPEFEKEILPLSAIELPGAHNIQNVLAACAISAALELPSEAVPAGLAGFKGVPHRLEFVRSWGGGVWYNDSIATAPERAIAAITSFEQPLILLAGGRDKDLLWDSFAETVRDSVDHLILFGEAVDVIQAALKDTPGDYSVSVQSGLEQAVIAAAALVEDGDLVLLAPGGTSFDEFVDFAARGERFKELVNAL